MATENVPGQRVAVDAEALKALPFYGRNYTTLMFMGIGSRAANGCATGQLRKQRPQKRFEWAPASDGAVVNGLTNLDGTRRPNRPLGSVERKAPWIPLKSTMGDDASGLAFQIRDHVFISNIEDATLG